MTDQEQKEREAVKRERAAWIAGARETSPSIIADMQGEVGADFWQNAAKRRYPLPKVTRPRVVVDGDRDEWRIKDGALQFRYESRAKVYGAEDEGWQEPTPSAFNSANWVRVQPALADLLANPLETVEAE